MTHDGRFPPDQPANRAEVPWNRPAEAWRDAGEVLPPGLTRPHDRTLQHSPPQHSQPQHSPPLAEPGAVKVSEPMSVLWQGVEYPVAEWDVMGFTLERAIPRLLSPQSGRVAAVTLLIGPRGTRIEMQVQARAVDPSETQPRGFRFIDLDRAQAEVLHRLVDASVERGAVSLTRLLNETEEVRTARAETRAVMQRAQKWIHLGLAGAAVALALALAVSNLTRVTARYAAVTASATAVSAPRMGLLTAVAVVPGQHVAAGDVLARLRPADHERSLDALEDRILTLEAETVEIAARRRALDEAGSVTERGTGAERDRLEQTLRLAENRLTAERAALAHVRANGLPTPERQARRARQEAEVAAAEQAVLQARSRIDALGQQAQLAGLGILPGSGTGLGTPEALELRAAHLRNELERLRQRQAVMIEGEPVLSPCDCAVTQVQHRAGEWTDPARPILTLAGADRNTIHALIPADRARGIRIGDRARIELADGTRLRGDVARMSYSAQWPGYFGLQDNVFAADRYARVEILPEHPIVAPLGMTAEVGIDSNRLLAPLRRWTGL